MHHLSFCRIIKFVLLFIILIIGDIHAVSQEVQGDKKLKNSVQVSGSTGIILGGFLLSCERSIVQLKHYTLNIEGGVGGYYFLDEPVAKGIKVPIQLNNLVGSKNHFFEISYGAGYFENAEKYSESPFMVITPILNLGYRFQSQNQSRGWVFRIFFGNTTGLGISCGMRF
jgi:hypothetical protein